MVAMMNTHSEVQLMMLKSKGGLHEIPHKSNNSSQKIWPPFMYHKGDNGPDELSENQMNNLPVNRPRYQRNYFTDIGVRIYLLI